MICLKKSKMFSWWLTYSFVRKYNHGKENLPRESYLPNTIKVGFEILRNKHINFLIKSMACYCFILNPKSRFYSLHYFDSLESEKRIHRRIQS